MVNTKSKKNQNQNNNQNLNANKNCKSVQKQQQRRKSAQKQQQRRKSVQKQQQQRRKSVQQQKQQQRRKSVQKQQQRRKSVQQQKQQQRRKSLNRTNQRNNKRQRSRKNSNKRRRRQKGGYVLQYSELPKMLNEDGKLVADFDSTKDYGELLDVKQGDFFDAEVGNDGDLSLDTSVLQTRDGREGRQTAEEARRSVTEMSDRRAANNSSRISEDIQEIGKLMVTERVYHDALDEYNRAPTNADGEKVGVDEQIEIIRQYGADNVARGNRITGIEAIHAERDPDGVAHVQADALLKAFGPGGARPPENKIL